MKKKKSLDPWIIFDWVCMLSLAFMIASCSTHQIYTDWMSR